MAKDIPKWFKGATGSRQEKEHEGSTGCPLEDMRSSSYRTDSIRLCPSFVELFKNTLLLRLPTDFIISYTGEYLIVQEAGAKGFVGHSYHDLKHQMDETYGQKNVNIKLDFDFMFVSDSPSKILITPPEYHFDEEVSCLKPMLGVLNTLPNVGIPFNVNTVVSLDYLGEKQEVYMKKGTPLAYLYFPEGAPSSVEHVSSDEYHDTRYTRTTFFGDYLRQVNRQEKQ